MLLRIVPVLLLLASEAWSLSHNATPLFHMQAGSDRMEAAYARSMPGPHRVQRVHLPKDSGRSPDDLVLSPEEAGSYPALVFNHGTALLATDYEEFLTHVASHGYIVMAPQIYRPQGLLTTSVAKEQRKALQTQVFVAERLEAWLFPGVRLDLTHGMFVAGHSRGGAVAFLTANDRPTQAPAVAGYVGVDPVDTKEVPISFLRKPALLTGAAAMFREWKREDHAPWRSLVFGTGLGSQQPACAPDGSNHVQFYRECESPSWHVVATLAGHMDMVNDKLSWLSKACTAVCKPSGLPRNQVRTWLGGLLVAFMQETDTAAQLQDYFNSTSASMQFTVESK